MKSVIATACCCLWALLVATSPAQPPESAASAPANGPTATTDPLLLAPPKTVEDTAARAALARERMANWQAATQPATQPTDEPAQRLLAARAALYREWEAYLTELERLSALQESLTTLAGEQRVQEVARKIEDLENKTAAVEAAPPPVVVSEDELAGVTAEHKQYDGELAALNELAARRQAQLTTGFKEQRARLTAELERLRTARQTLQASIDAGTTTAPAERESSALERRRLDVQIAAVELTGQALTFEQEQTELLQKQDERLLEALRRYVGTLRQRVSALNEAKRRSVLDIIKIKRTRTTVPHELALLDLQYFKEDLLLSFFENRERREALQERFTVNDLTRLHERISLSAATWNEAVSDLSQRSGQETIALRADVREEQRSFEAELTHLHTLLAETLDELHQMQTVRERATDHFRQLQNTLSDRLQAVDSAERTRIETEATALRSKMDESMKAMIAEAQDLRQRLDQAVEETTAHVATLADAEHKLYWIALGRRESGLADLDWGLLRHEWGQLVSGGHAADADKPAVLAELLEPPDDVRTKLGAQLQAIRDDLRNVGGIDWLLAAIVLIVSGAIGWFIRHAARTQAEGVRARLAAETVEPADGTPARQFSARLHLLWWRLLRDLGVVAGIAFGAWLAAALIELPPRTRWPGVAVLGSLLGVYALLVLLRRLFDPEERQRVMPCDDVVARHYRRWGEALLIFTLVLVPLLAFLTTAATAPGTRQLLWELWKSGVLALLAGFLLRRRRVMGADAAGGATWRHALLAAGYPLLFLGVLALLILQVIGYGLLVEYVCVGVLSSLAILVLVLGTVEYVCDLLDGLQQQRTPATQAPRMLKTLLRLVGLAAIVILIVHVWGGRGYLRQLTWQQIAFFLAAVVAALVVDRLVLTALFALRTSGQLPESTSNMIRRWTRGLLTTAVVFFVIALAGAPVGMLWAPLSALFAMVAVGFIAVWSVLSNILATLIILIWRPFNVGEEIEIQPDGIAGTVIDINFMFTLLRGEGGTRTTVPNSLFVQKFVRRHKVIARPRRSLAEQLVADRPAND
ncbi:MAG: mechanosensitive ion channel [Phycisphaerae bacterium]